MSRILFSRHVITAAQYFSPIFPITNCLGSPGQADGSVSRSGSFQIAWASSKSNPCLALLAALFAGAYSKSTARLYHWNLALTRSLQALAANLPT